MLALQTVTSAITGHAETLRDSLASTREAETTHATAVKAVQDVRVELDQARAACERAETDLDTLCGELGTREDIATAPRRGHGAQHRR